jgi:hypothetical protein
MAATKLVLLVALSRHARKPLALHKSVLVAAMPKGKTMYLLIIHQKSNGWCMNSPKLLHTWFSVPKKRYTQVI